jgi:hypothetical protein
MPRSPFLGRFPRAGGRLRRLCAQALQPALITRENLAVHTSIAHDRLLPCICRLMADAVEKGKNELTEIFPCVPAETGS